MSPFSREKVYGGESGGYGSKRGKDCISRVLFMLCFDSPECRQWTHASWYPMWARSPFLLPQETPCLRPLPAVVWEWRHATTAQEPAKESGHHKRSHQPIETRDLSPHAEDIERLLVEFTGARTLWRIESRYVLPTSPTSPTDQVDTVAREPLVLREASCFNSTWML
jgi:hypothetical protein